MSSPFCAVEPLSDRAFSVLRRRVIFEGTKWDPQVGDVCTIARAPLVIRRSLWRELSRLAEQLDAELSAMEIELLERPALLRRLALPRALLRHLPGEPPARTLRLRRYDFHLAEEGIRLSEVNADVPGGFHEGVTAALYQSHYPHTAVPGSPVAALAAALRERLAGEAVVALVHATSYSDDRQHLVLLARMLEADGLRATLCAPDHLSWGRECRLRLGGRDERVDAVVRFFPAEWLPACPADCGWPGFVRGPALLCNPATSVVVQSKRLPLVFDALAASSRAWRSVLPTTVGIGHAPWWRGHDWILKPALGRVGEGIVAVGTTPSKELRAVAAHALLHPSEYVAQRRFRPIAWSLGGVSYHPCIGVFTLDGKVVGAYGRASHAPFVDHRAVEAPVLLQDDETS